MTHKMLTRIALFLAVIGALSFVMGWCWFEYQLSPVSNDAAPTVIRIMPGASVHSVARDLQNAGLIRDAKVFRWHAWSTGMDTALRAGEYKLSASLGAKNILQRLSKGQVHTHTVSIPEGLRIEEIAARLSEAGLVDPEAFLTFARDPQTVASFDLEGQSLEGYLFPETYRLARGLSPREVAATMVDQFKRVWQDIEKPAKAQGLGMREVVTLASIVEKETSVPDERPLIAAVFLNRLKRGMRLETDPTVIYGIPNFDGNLRRIHLEDASNPYNTYRIQGLPPGPIANPGEAALRAVVAPADSPYLFFVAYGDGSGRHAFSKTYPEHEKKVNRYQRRR